MNKTKNLENLAKALTKKIFDEKSTISKTEITSTKGTINIIDQLITAFNDKSSIPLTVSKEDFNPEDSGELTAAALADYIAVQSTQYHMTFTPITNNNLR